MYVSFGAQPVTRRFWTLQIGLAALRMHAYLYTDTMLTYVLPKCTCPNAIILPCVMIHLCGFGSDDHAQVPVIIYQY